MSEPTRREFLATSAALAAATHLTTMFSNHALAASPASAPAQGIALRWLENAPAFCPGATWGVPWPRGTHKPQQSFALRSASGKSIPLQTWPLAYWPDGSLKWTAHAIPAATAVEPDFMLAPGRPAEPTQRVEVVESPDSVKVSTGAIQVIVPRHGSNLIESIQRDGRTIAGKAQLVGLLQDQPSLSDSGTVRSQSFTSAIDKVTVEQGGPVRAVVRIEGKHAAGAGNRTWLPFTVRLYFYANAESVRIVHTFIFDGDENKDFIRGLGLRFDTAMAGPLHDRHVRLAGEGDGLWAEGVRNLTGLRRDAGREVTQKQLAGEACPPLQQFPQPVRERLNRIPAWSDYTLFQPTADSFEIRKRTSEKCCWITAGHAHRASGLGYIGSPSGGVAFGLRDFWQRHPTQLDIRNATSDVAQVTLWLWSPDAPAMDLRFYHDGMGMNTHAEELEGLDITYEDYEKGFGTPHGIARTSEMMLWALSATPTRQHLVEISRIFQAPPLLVCAPETYHAAEVFGSWSVADRSSPARKKIEDQLDWYISYYQKQIEQRRWYGFWNYGDVMHTYDRDRHVWRYDVGGFAWDNSELSSDLWLWYSFLRSGRADVFRMAEAMTRHTGEVDVYHLGRFAGVGSRHNVLHWGDSAKQHRISTAVYRRFYYYLTADERVGDLMRELVDSDRTFLALDPIRKIRRGRYEPNEKALSVGFGTDWGSLAAAWLTEWERNPQAKCREKLFNGMKSIGDMKYGFFTNDATYDLATGTFADTGKMDGSVSHLSAVFGLPEICAELIQLIDMPGFERAWLQYCELYNAPRQEQEKALGTSLKGAALMSAHSRLTAYAARKKRDSNLAARAWKEFLGGEGRRGPSQRFGTKTETITGPAVLQPVDEAPWVSTNDTAQWSLSAIENLQLVPDALPSAISEESA